MEPIQDDNDQISFQYANDCDLEIHCSPFGLSGLYIKVKGTNIMGVGSTMGLITGSTKGLIHYNDSQDLMDQKYKLYLVVEDDGMLRIDFTKISPLAQGSEDISAGPAGVKLNKKDEESVGKSPASVSTGGSSSYQSSSKSPKPLDKIDTGNTLEGETNLEEDSMPSLIFRGKCPDGRPSHIQPFIGIFSFERED
ncbi:hypothetical protein PSN45_000899 [Yamadazyma tenuis]|uniref:Uncharacterized protein n=1 Tax=Candida tenuis (strain ATCC 10573 / BCRC 21748 / CBS 615 / JCM 9827 / NBRC 10315 / NRRL Y-1498 / VKM Y-70) TaxID=590646 RepID=G3BBF6_CANTC|nr:uncharacterized protein CANTEDRAFT_125790 [Yamadazyma tenuis ATCC 10573]EGV62809.1 hypothetical protein CANTEDRAFT_125790 [Yamadazyma tenuis ATCC 10573]WEJ93436.1 hypothetical protein PSN45_000899 [Yamadazyma tenuis]